jgi:hypothetical protein
LRRALPTFLLALRPGLANRSRHGAYSVSVVSWYVDHPFRDGLWHAGLHRGKQARSSSAAPFPQVSLWRHQFLDYEALLAKAVHRIVIENVTPEQAVDEAIARISRS